MEDPYIREEYERRLIEEGVKSRMKQEWFVPPKEKSETERLWDVV